MEENDRTEETKAEEPKVEETKPVDQADGATEEPKAEEEPTGAPV